MICFRLKTRSQQQSLTATWHVAVNFRGRFTRTTEKSTLESFSTNPSLETSNTKIPSCSDHLAGLKCFASSPLTGTESLVGVEDPSSPCIRSIVP
jgi:hypothetical protein